MSTQGWIFMVGFRVIDIGALIVFLVWFFRLRDDGDEGTDDDGPGGGGPEPSPRSGPRGGLRVALGRASAGRGRLRDHRGGRVATRRRGVHPVPGPSPARVRRPRAPVPAHRR